MTVKPCFPPLALATDPVMFKVHLRFREISLTRLVKFHLEESKNFRKNCDSSMRQHELAATYYKEMLAEVKVELLKLEGVET